MKKVRVQTTFQTDIISVPDEIEIEIEKYQEEFLRWVEGRSFVDGLKGTVFGTVNFVDYLNENALVESKEKVFLYKAEYKPTREKEIQEFKKMKKIYF